MYFSSLLIFIRQYIKKNINGITKEYTETLFTVSAKNIGIKPEINDENNAALVLFVISFAIRYTIKIRHEAKIFGNNLQTRLKGMKRLKKARIYWKNGWKRKFLPE